MFFSLGILREPGLPRGRPEDLPDPGDPRHRPLRAVEDWPLQELPAGHPRRPRRPHPRARPAVDEGLQGAEGHPHAAREVREERDSFRISVGVRFPGLKCENALKILLAAVVALGWLVQISNLF